MQLQKPTDVTYRPSTRKVFISRDIFVDEAAPPQACEQADPKEKPLVDNTPAPTKREELRTFSDQHLQPPPPTSTDGSGSPHRSPTTTSPQFASTPTISLPADTAHEQLTVEFAEPAPSPTLSKPPTIDPPRRSNKIRRFPRHLHDYAAHVQLQTPDLIPEDFTDNITFKQAQLNPNWRAAMQEELDSIYSNHTWSLVPLPPHTKAITSRWVFKIKTGTGDQTRFKARLVARGFEQTNKVDFLDTFAPVVRWETIRTLLAIAVHLN